MSTADGSPPGEQNEAAFKSDSTPPDRRRTRIWAVGAVLLVAVAAGLFAMRGGQHKTRVDGQTLAVSAGPGQGVRLKGMTQAVEARSIQAPLIAGATVGALTITKLVPSGTRVRKGDLLVEFDRQAQVRDAMDKQAIADDQDEKVVEGKTKEAAARSKDETEITQAEDALSKAKLEMEKVETMSRIDAEKAQENLDETQATLKQLKETFDLKREAALASIRILEIQRDRTRETMLHAQANSALMQVHAPIDGLVVLNTIWKQGSMGEVQEGDQVRPGVPFMQVIDPALMEVLVPVNQEDLLGLKVGEKAKVHLDAYSDLVFDAQLESIDPMGTQGDFSNKLRKFSAMFSIEGHDAKLMPDLSAAVDLSATSAGGGSE